MTNYIMDCLSNQIPLSISKTYINRFKLIYPHETKKTLDLYIIIEVNDGDISVITAYPKNKKRREHER